MEERKAVVPGISCAHCVATIRRELGEIPGVESVAGDPGARTVTVRWGPPATWERIAAALAEIGFPPEGDGTPSGGSRRGTRPTCS
ncbi:MAG: heavy-metal-associated domain-containing protein [Planctomycetes bacterium]|nr:heavy-metal-associated domain-containing protein [Planctomycetota bacterium]